MEDLYFWKTWNRPFKLLYFACLTIFSLAVIFFCVGWYLGLNAVIDWILIPDFQTIDASVDNFTRALVNYTVDVNTFLIKQRYDSSDLIITPGYSYTYLLFIVAGFCLFLTVMTYLEIFWFGLGMAAFVFFLASLKTELLKIGGMENRLFLISLIISFLGLSYYFQSIKKDIPFFRRITLFASLFILFALVITITSGTQTPLFLIANFSIPIPIILTLLFLVTISYDIVFGFLYIVTSGKSLNPSSRLINFSVISILYIINLLLILMKKMLFIDWDILYVSPFFIYLISCVVGIWSYGFRTKSSNDVIPFKPLGAFYYMALAIISTASMALAFITGNDPLVDMFEYMIIYTHFAFGLIFFLYVLINFGDLFKKNMSLYKVVYIPTRMPFFIMQGVSCTIVLGLFLYSNRFAYFLGASGYYNLGGDVYNHQKNSIMATEYYREGYFQAFQNHRSNYSLATLALQQGNNATAQQYLTQALVRHPSEFAYVKLSNLYLDANMVFPAKFMLQDATAQFSESPMINNNLGLVYAKTNMLDSVYYSFDKAMNSSGDKGVAAANMLAFLTEKGLLQDADSLAGTFSLDNELAFQNNLLIIKTSLNKPYEKHFKESAYKDSILEGNAFPYLYNFGLTNIRNDKNEVFDIIGKLANVEINHDFRDHLLLIDNLRKWYKTDQGRAITNLDLIINSKNETAPYFSKIIGMLLFKQKAYYNAAYYLNKAHQDTDQEAMLYYAIALIELNRLEESKTYLNKVAQSEFSDLKLVANNLLLLLNADASKLSNLDDELRYQYLHFFKDNLSQEHVNTIFTSIQKPNIKLLAAAELIELNLDRDNIASARDICDQFPAPQKEDSYFSGVFNLQYLRLLDLERNFNLLGKSLKIYLNEDAQNELLYFTARIEEASKNFSKADKSFEKAWKMNVFNETVLINTAKYFQTRNQADIAYSVLLSGLEFQPDNVKLLKAYATLAKQMNLQNFVESVLEKLKGLMPASEYQKFATSINS